MIITQNHSSHLCFREEILAAVRDNPVVIVAGDTGCGKSTQLPQYLLQDGYNSIGENPVLRSAMSWYGLLVESSN